MSIIKATPGTVIHIGYTGENFATVVEFDISNWFEEYGPGTTELIITQKGKTWPNKTTSDNKKLIWEINKDYVVEAGFGKCQLWYTSNEGNIVKSEIYDFLVTKSLDYNEPSNPPEPFKSWVEEVTKEAADIKQNIQTAINSANTAITNAIEAKNSAEIATTKASEALNAQNNAQNSATNAENSAVAAANSADAAEEEAKKAVASAENAQNSATVALNNATIATTKAAEAATSETNASASAATATTSAENAEISAQKAENISLYPPYIGDISKGENPDYWYIWDKQTNQYKKSTVKARFSIVAVYKTENAMYADTNREIGDFVIVSSSLDEEDAVLWVLGENGWSRVTTLSGYEGVGINTIEGPIYPSTDGGIDIYTINLTNGEKYDFKITSGIDGNSITSIVPNSNNTGAPGTQDSYTITFNKAEPISFKVYNGLDGVSSTFKIEDIPGGHRITIKDKNHEESFDVLNGEGRGDMLASEYDKENTVIAAGGIDDFVKLNSSKVLIKTWTAEDINN